MRNNELNYLRNKYPELFSLMFKDFEILNNEEEESEYWYDVPNNCEIKNHNPFYKSISKIINCDILGNEEKIN